MKQHDIPDLGYNQASSHEEPAPKNVQRTGPLSLATQFRPEWIIIPALILISGSISFYRLEVPSVWFDEAFTVGLINLPFPLFWNITFGREPNMELYYLLAYGWVHLMDLMGIHQTEFIIRFPSAVFTTITPVVVFLFGRRYSGLLAGTLAALLYALNILQIAYALQARAYSMQLLLICISWYALIRILSSEQHTKRWWIIYTAMSALTIYTHLASALIFMAQCFTFASLLIIPNAWREHARKQFWTWLINIGAFILLIIPMIYVSRNGSRTGWLPAPGLSDIIKVFRDMVGGDIAYFLLLATGACLAIVIVIGSYILQRMPELQKKLFSRSTIVQRLFSQQQFAPVIWALLCWVIVTLAVSFIISQSSARMFSSRYMTIIIAPTCLLAGAGIAALRYRAVQTIFTAALVLFASLLIPQYYRSAQVEDWNYTSHWIVQQHQTSDGLICYDNNQGCQIAMEYYLLHVYPESGIRFEPESPGYYNWEQYGTDVVAINADDAINTQKLDVYARNLTRLFFITGRLSGDEKTLNALNTQQWLDEHYRFIDEITTRTVTVRLYEIP